MGLLETVLVLQRFVGRRPVIIKQEGDASTIPSVVAYLPDGQVLVGKAAQRWVPSPKLLTCNVLHYELASRSTLRAQALSIPAGRPAHNLSTPSTQ